MKKWLCLIALALSLTGCKGLSNKNDIVSLLSPPKLSERESLVITAIKSFLGEDIILKYPKQGNNISPVQIVDLEKDGTEEAVVLYSAPNKGANVRMAVLTQKNGQWQVTSDTEGFGTEVYRVEVAQISPNTPKQLVLGYTYANSSEKFLTVYFLEDGEIVNSHSENCQDFILSDVTQDGYQDIVLASINADKQQPTMQIISTHYGSSLTRIAQHPILVDNATVTQIAISLAQTADAPAILIDYKDNYHRVYTEAVSLDGFEMKSIFKNDTVQKIWQLPYDLVSMDVDQDGYMETPTIITSEDQSNAQPLRFMEWTSYLFAQPTRKFFGVCDTLNGLFIPLPDEWQNHVSFKTYANNRQWEILQTGTDRALVSFKMVLSGEKPQAELNEEIVSIGAMKIKLKFDAQVSKEQKQYILSKILYIK